MNALSTKNFRWVDRLAFAVVGLMTLQIVPILVTWSFAERWPEALAPITTLYWVANFPLALVFSHSLGYLLLLVAASGLLLLAIFVGQHRRLPIALLAGFAVVLLYALAPWYQYPLQAAQGYQLEAVTAPGWWERGLRFNQAMAERVPCSYRLEGWNAEEQLYYTATCRGTASYCRYTPASERRQQVEAIPTTLTGQPSDRDTILAQLRAPGVRPSRQEPSVRPLLLRDAGLVSPDRRYTALITNHHYSVQDVMLLEKEILR